MQSFEYKLYCSLLKIKFDEFEKLTLDQQIDLLNNLNNLKLGSSKVLIEAKEKLLAAKYKEKEERIQLNKDINEAIKIVNSAHEKRDEEIK